MIQFGTGGWRALIGEDFTRDNVRILAQGLANTIRSGGRGEEGFVIGYDRRFLSDKAAVWFAEVMAANGIKVYFIEKIAPTPLIMFTVKNMSVRYGAAVTASHNPADYNGVKIFTEGGRDASVEAVQEIEYAVRAVGADGVKSLDFGKALADGAVVKIDPFNDYIDSVLSMIDTAAIRSRGLKVLLDPMFGVSKTCLQTVLITARCELDVINDRHDTLFGGRLPSPSSHTLHKLADLVAEKGYDLGIGTDGDADRLGIVDEKGEFIHPNSILVVLYYYLLKYKKWKGGVVRNLATTHLLDRIADAFGEECHEVPVGFKHISAAMEGKNALLGGESSGGLTIRGHIRGKDGVFAAALLVELLSVTGRSLSGLLEDIGREFGYFYMEEADFRLTDAERERISRLLFRQKLVPGFRHVIRKVSYMDGLKVYFENGGWIVARFSGTEPLLRIFAEMDSRAEAAAVLAEMKAFLNMEPEH
jgi:phosphomannomutase